MNYLAHLYLSFGNKEILIGNFIADSVKGKQINTFPENVQSGIRLHREIDSFTDSHPVVKNSKNRLRANYKKYAGVVVDIFYDHFLAANWNGFSDESLISFTKNSYKILFRNYFTLPWRVKRILPMMAVGNWLASYAETKNISLALQGISRRTNFNSGIEKAGTDLIENYDLFKDEFMLFFPDVIQFSRSFLEKHFPVQ